MFVSVWTNVILHFDNHTNNRVESQHAKLKKYLDTHSSKLDRFFEHIDNTVKSQYTAIKANLEKSRISKKHRHGNNVFGLLWRRVSLNALDKMNLEFDRPGFHQITEVNCGCHLRRSCGLPCAHEISFYCNTSQQIPLESIDTFWRILDLETAVPGTEYADQGIEEEVELFMESYDQQSTDGKASYRRKMRNIFSPITSMINDPAVHKNTRGRPPGKTKQAQANPPVRPPQNPQTEDPRRHSFAAYTPDYTWQNMFDLNQQPEPVPERHSTYSSGNPSMFNQQQTYRRSHFDIQLLNEIPYNLRPYVARIEDVVGDGNCGFRAVAVSLGFTQDYWDQIRVDLHQELLMHFEDYERVFENDIYGMMHVIDRHESPTIREFWMVMPDTGYIIANKYGVIVHFLSEQGSSTIFPLWRGPQDYSHHREIAIALVYGGHYVQVDLQEGHPMPNLLPLWRARRSSRAAGWETLYRARLNAYIPQYRPSGDRINLSDN